MEIKMSLIPGKNPGKVGKINVKVGDQVSKDDELAQVETGKGNRVIKALSDGVISKVYFEEGQEIKSNQVMFDLQEASVQVSVEIEQIKMSLIPGKNPGKVGKINVKVGDQVSKDDELAQVETGKGNRAIKALSDGVISKVYFEEGQEIKSNEVMFDLKIVKKEIVEEDVKDVEEVNTDLMIIGGGPGGYVAAIYGAKCGLNVVLAEDNKLGGTCLNVGCIPTKAFVKSAEVFQNISRSKEFGIALDGIAKPDMKKIVERKDQVKDKLIQGIEFLMDKNKITVLKGKASFYSKDEVFVKGEKAWLVKAKNIIIASGSKVSRVPIEGIDSPLVMNSTQALSCEKLPSTITIIGGGVIGMEFAFIYNSLGVKVNVVEFMDRLLTMLDKEASQEIEIRAKEAGIHIYTNSKVKSIKTTKDDQAVVIYENHGKEELLVSDNVLVAIGREPNIDGLDIEKSGVVLNDHKRGIKVDSHMKTNIENIYAIGDVTNIMQLAHVASHQGITAIDNILGKNKEMDYSAVPNVVFTMPEIASVGLTEEKCIEKKIDYKVSRFNFEGNGKALTLGENHGFIKLIALKENDLIIGGTIIGPDASSLIATITTAITNNITAKEISHTIFAHPTTAEVIHEAALGLTIGALHQ